MSFPLQKNNHSTLNKIPNGSTMKEIPQNSQGSGGCMKWVTISLYILQNLIGGAVPNTFTPMADQFA
jgi:hypothetical protein